MPERNTRQHLIETGLTLLQTEGYTATGVKEVLDRAGVPKGSFYHYFPSKEAFVQEVLGLYATQESERWERLLNDSAAAPLRRLRRYFEELIATYGQSGRLSGGCLIGKLSLEIAAHSPALQSHLSQAFNYWQQAIAHVLREAIERDDLPRSTRPNQLAAFLLNSWEGALLRSQAEKSDQPLDLFLHYTFNVLLRP